MDKNIISKRCYTCKQTKPVTRFHKNRTKNDGYYGQCAICRSKYRKIKNGFEETKFIGLLDNVPVTTKEVKSFWRKVKFNPRGCWEWQAQISAAGYGMIWVKNRSRGAHRLSYLLYYLQDPIGLFVCHKCDNPRCVNPFHLFLDTPLANMRDKISKGRDNRTLGEINGCAKLTNEQVLQIRKIATESNLFHKEIADQFGISRTAVTNIINRKSWAHI